MSFLHDIWHSGQNFRLLINISRFDSRVLSFFKNIQTNIQTFKKKHSNIQKKHSNILKNKTFKNSNIQTFKKKHSNIQKTFKHTFKHSKIHSNIQFVSIVSFLHDTWRSGQNFTLLINASRFDSWVFSFFKNVYLVENWSRLDVGNTCIYIRVGEIF